MNYDCIVKDCRLFDNPRDARPVDILINDGTIGGIEETGSVRKSSRIIDASGRTVIPGLIDIHIQGAGGSDVLDGTETAIRTMSETLARLGTTSFVATTVTKPDTDNAHIRETARLVGTGLGGAELLGLHLEGPFINPEKRGGIAPEAIYPVSQKAIGELFDITGGTLSMMTVAPELEGAGDVISALTATDIIASLGHTTATYEETLTGFEAGISHVTHIFNAMPSIHHRTPGPIPAILETPHISVQLIGDGVHVHPSIVRMLYKTIGTDRIVCITDGVQAMGLPEGRYIYNGREYKSRDGSARYPDGTLIGSTLSLLDIVLRFAEFTGCPFTDAVKTATANPAELLGTADRKGAIEIGKDADLVILDNDFSVKAAIVRGSVRYER